MSAIGRRLDRLEVQAGTAQGGRLLIVDVSGGQDREARMAELEPEPSDLVVMVVE